MRAGFDYGRLAAKLREELTSGDPNTKKLLSDIIAEKLIEKLRIVSVFVDNGLDQAVTVQVKANREKAYAKAVNVGSAFTVSANSADARTLSPDTSGWLPYIMVEVSCSTAPTSGALDVYLVRSKDDQPKLVDSLAISDTSPHNPSTDPAKVIILEW
jgi:hypothetical protein